MKNNVICGASHEQMCDFRIINGNVVLTSTPKPSRLAPPPWVERYAHPSFGLPRSAKATPAVSFQTSDGVLLQHAGCGFR